MDNGFSKHTVPTLKVNNGFDMPILALGVWCMDKPDIKQLIINAIKILNIVLVAALSLSLSIASQ